VGKKIQSEALEGLFVGSILCDDPKKCMDWLYLQLSDAIEEHYKHVFERNDPILDQMKKVLMNTRITCGSCEKMCFIAIQKKVLQVVGEKLQNLRDDENCEAFFSMFPYAEFSKNLKRQIEKKPHNLMELKSEGMPSLEELTLHLNQLVEKENSIKQIAMCLSLISVVVRDDERCSKELWYRQATKLRHQDVLDTDEVIKLAKEVLVSLQGIALISEGQDIKRSFL